MEFWDNFSKTVSDAADYTVKEAGKLTGIAKLKYKIATTRARLDTLFAGLGRLKYDEVKATTSSGAESVDMLVGKIDALKADLERYENELAKLKNVRICAACRSEIGLEMAFCPRCGSKQPEPEPSGDDNCDCDCGCDCGCEDECDCGCEDDCDCDGEDDCDCDGEDAEEGCCCCGNADESDEDGDNGEDEGCDCCCGCDQER